MGLTPKGLEIEFEKEAKKKISSDLNLPQDQIIYISQPIPGHGKVIIGMTTGNKNIVSSFKVIISNHFEKTTSVSININQIHKSFITLLCGVTGVFESTDTKLTLSPGDDISIRVN